MISEIRSAPAEAPSVARDDADAVTADEQSSEASFSVLLAWLSGAMPPEPRLFAEPHGAMTASGSPLQNAAAAGQSLPQAGNTLPLLPQSMLPTAQAALEERPLLETFNDIQAELARRAPVSTAASALLGQTLDVDSKGTRSSASTIDLSFLTSSVSQSPATTTVEGNRGQTALGAGLNPVSTQTGQPQLENAMGQRMVWMAQQGVHDARVRVHPEHLGPIEIRLKLEGDVAQVTFHSPHSVVRDALTEAVPRLRELMGDAGLSLSHVGVDAGGSESRQSRDGAESDRHATVGPHPDTEILEADVRPQTIARGLVDTFA